MKNRVMNPYLPLYEYIPDGEPRVFGDRIYVYGSHDFAGGEKGFCPGDYMVWSAPLNDLSNWECDGIGFKREQCPELTEQDAMAAPDVVRGADGRYYMYFNTNHQKVCHVAISDFPEGPFTYFGCVQTADGCPYDEYKMFDPGVLVDDDGRVYLYTGFCMVGPVPDEYKDMPSPFAETSIGFELANDMKTIISGPYPIIPGGNVTEGTSFVGHGFFEASSPRKIDGKYVMVYSSELSHDLVYAVSDSPLENYEYKGILVSNADIGLHGNESPVMPYGNNHGGLVEIEKEWYIFYHRQTHAIECCRQGCAEKLVRREDGWFEQAEITSNGLMGQPLQANGIYNACYCCYLTADSMSKEALCVWANRRETEPYIYEEIVGTKETEFLHYITNITGKTTVGYKYFEWNKPKKVWLKMRGKGTCQVFVHVGEPTGECIGSEKFLLMEEWKEFPIKVQSITGTFALYFEIIAQDAADFMEFGIA